MNKKLDWQTKRYEGATHAIDDGGTIYYTTASGMTPDQIAEAFRDGYDGECGTVWITDLTTDEETTHAE